MQEIRIPCTGQHLVCGTAIQISEDKVYGAKIYKNIYKIKAGQMVRVINGFSLIDAVKGRVVVSVYPEDRVYSFGDAADKREAFSIPMNYLTYFKIVEPGDSAADWIDAANVSTPKIESKDSSTRWDISFNE